MVIFNMVQKELLKPFPACVQAMVLASSGLGAFLDTQTTKKHTLGHPNFSVWNF